MNFHYIRKPYRHQHKTVVFMLKNHEAAVFSDPGTGKTKSAIDTARFLKKFKGAKRVLIVGPLCVLWQWEKEITLSSFYPKAVLYGSVEKRLKLLRKTKPKFFIINYEALLIDRVFNALLKKGFDAVVFDESIKIKNWKAKRTKRSFLIARTASNVYLLSGRPITNAESDIFGQYLVLDGGTTFGNNFFRFRNRFYRRAGPYKWVLRSGALETIKDLMYKKAISFTKDECLDLPPKVFETKDIILSPEQRKAYTEIDQVGMTKLHDHAGDINYIVKYAIARWIKKQQITSGFLYKDDKTAFDFKHNPKLEELRELINTEFYGERVVIVGRFHHDLDLIRSVLPARSVEISGRTRAAQMAARFQEEPDIRYAVVQIGAGGLGIDLYTAHILIYYAKDFRLDNYEQVQDRLHRLGQIAAMCLYVDLTAKDSVDERMNEAIARRKNISDYLLGIDIKEGRIPDGYKDIQHR